MKLEDVDKEVVNSGIRRSTRSTAGKLLSSDLFYYR